MASFGDVMIWYFSQRHRLQRLVREYGWACRIIVHSVLLGMLLFFRFQICVLSSVAFFFLLFVEMICVLYMYTLTV